MKTPRTRRGETRILVSPPQNASGTIPVSAPPSEQEAWEIVKAIGPQFKHYADMYDTNKYWPDVYRRGCEAFRQPTRVVSGTLREVILWKYGHLGKPGIPPAHERLISQLQSGWQVAVAALPPAPNEAFFVLDRYFGGKTRFITVAFLLHLLHPRQVPIIDQHNFRAVNALMEGARPAWRSRRKPSKYEDITLVAAFMRAILKAWRRHAPDTVPPHRELDKFLMMYGKAIKKRSNKKPLRRVAH